AQLHRAFGFGPKGWGLESLRARQSRQGNRAAVSERIKQPGRSKSTEKHYPKQRLLNSNCLDEIDADGFLSAKASGETEHVAHKNRRHNKQPAECCFQIEPVHIASVARNNSTNYSRSLHRLYHLGRASN